MDGHLGALGLTELRINPDPVRVASEAALWGALCAQKRLGSAIILSDDAGQFRLGQHALCWVHAERLVHKLVPANDRQRNAVEVARQMIWWFYRQLKTFKADPSPQRAAELRAALTASSTAEPDTPRSTGSSSASSPTRTNCCACSSGRRSLNTNASENDIRAVVTKRKVSGGRQRKRTHRPRRHARPRQDLRQTQDLVLRLPRRAPPNPRAANPASRNPGRVI